METLKMAYNAANLRTGDSNDGSFVRTIQKQHSEALGFLPGGAIDAYLASGRVLLGAENGDNAGYILGRPQMRYDNRIAPITQAAVAMDLKRRHLGLAMVDQWVTSAFLAGKACVQCWCADDLDSRFFWPAAGFVAIARRWPMNTRSRSLTLWRRSTSSAPLTIDFFALPPLAGFRASKVGRVESLMPGSIASAAAVIRSTSADAQLFLFDALIDDGRLTTADCFR